jgi:hypothetical protein
MLYLSTDSPEDLTELNSDLVLFEGLSDDDGADLLLYPHKWYVGSKSGCSCTFRHLVSTELGFSDPLDWVPEEEDEIQATAALYKVIAKLHSDGHKVDLLDIWESDEAAEILSVQVDLGSVPESAFRLFENHHFIFDNQLSS